MTLYKGLNFKLAAGGFLIVAIPLAVIEIFSVHQMNSTMELLCLSKATEGVKELSSRMDQHIREEMALTNQTASRLSIINAATAKLTGNYLSPDISKAGTELTRLVEQSNGELAYMHIADPDGIVFTDSSYGEMQDLNVAAQDTFRNAVSGKVSAGSIMTAETGERFLPISAPIYSENKQVIGVVMTAVKFSTLVGNVSAHSVLGKTGQILIIDPSGNAIHADNIEAGINAKPARMQDMRSLIRKPTTKEADSEILTDNGTRKIAGIAPISTSGWRLVTMRDYDELMAPAHRSRSIICAIAITSFAGAQICLFIFSNRLSSPIHNVAQDLEEASSQVAVASGQVSAASRALADSASDQAAAVEEIASTMEEMNAVTRLNADNARNADLVLSEFRTMIDCVNGDLTKAVAAIHRASESSAETEKIVRSIDAIAFQTTILAINAAVQAGRAGEAGAAFTVIANEIRTLALRVSEEAKNSSELIGNTIATVENGCDRIRDAHHSFADSMHLSEEFSRRVKEITAASDSQEKGILQISGAIRQIDAATQHAARNADESAIAASQMRSQAERLLGFAHGLTMIVDGTSRGSHQMLVKQPMLV